MASKRPVRVGDVYQIGPIRFEVTAFDLVSYGVPIAIGVETFCGDSIEGHHSARSLAGPGAILLSGGSGQAVEVPES